MTLREALDLLELNERTLEQSMLESSLQNRLEHTELRHVLRVFEAYRKVNAFLNPSFNTQGDARMTIIDESVPGGPMLEVTRADVSVTAASSAMPLKNSDTFSDTMIETSTAWEAMQSGVRPGLTNSAAPVRRGDGVNLFVMLGLVAAAFGLGAVVLGPPMSLLLNRPVSSNPVPSVSSSPVPAVVAVAPVVVVLPPSAPGAQPAPSATTVQPAPPVAAVQPAAPAVVAAVVKPAAPAITKPATRPVVSAKPAVTTKPVVDKPAVVSQPRVVTTPHATAPRASTPRATAPRASTPRVVTTPRIARPQVTAPRASTPRVTAPRASTPRAIPQVSSRPVSMAVPSRPRVNERQFSQWDKAGAVLRYRSWALVPASLRGLSPSAFKAAVFVARNPASLPDVAR